ncbi:MAG: orotidine-5'-phosphate decarboxylase [Thermoanaerobaculia bacterium]
MSRPLDRVAVALDTPDAARLEAWSATFGPHVGALKVGLTAFTSLGPAAVEIARAHSDRVFLDLKLHDIPNTVAGAVRAARELGVRYLTVHTAGGRAVLEAARREAGDALRLLGVTLLTHLDAGDLSELDLGDGRRRVARWAELARDCGFAGVVCSPREVAELRARFPPPFELVTPGIRWRDGTDDQRRVAAPEAALAAGADLLVIGRPLTAAPDSEAALAALADRLSPVPVP